MKLVSVLLIFLTAFNTCAEPLLVVVLMVKNEALVIKKTLEPYVKAGITDFIVFDTGSTDGTQAIARTFFKEHNLTNAHIIEEPFIDFSTSRNRALELTEQIFPEAIFMLMPDAEWYMHGTHELIAFCKQHLTAQEASYLILIQNAYTAFYVGRLIRCRSGVRFVGPVHECLNQVSAVKVPTHTYFEWGYSEQGMRQSKARWIRDRDLLYRHYEQNPTDPRTLFYLAQTYELLSDLEKAYEFYEKRAAINGWDEENFITQLRLGNLAAHIQARTQEGVSYTAVMHFLKAFEMRPHRAEPLVKLAQHYMKRSSSYNLAYLFAARAAQIPYPEHDILFVEKYAYEFERYDILSIVSCYVGQKAVGAWATSKALEAKPDAPHLHYNAQFYR